MSWVLLWMLLNTFFGIKLGLLFLDEEVTYWHGIYYAAMIGSFIWVFRHLSKKWKKLPPLDKMGDELQD